MHAPANRSRLSALLLSALLAPALVLLAAGCGSGSSLQGSDDALESAREQCVATINAYRQQAGVSRMLSRWSAAEACSDSQCQSDSQTGAAHGAFGRCGEQAQNECPGWGSVQQILEGGLAAMFAEGPGGGHYVNMTNPNYGQVACGFHQKSDGSWWAVQNFR